jgi:hypothetical protein
MFSRAKGFLFCSWIDVFLLFFCVIKGGRGGRGRGRKRGDHASHSAPLTPGAHATSPGDGHAAEEQAAWEIRCVCGTDDDAGFMIQCDTCGVWQHGDCVHIQQATVPEHFYCDICEDLMHSSVCD